VERIKRPINKIINILVKFPFNFFVRIKPLNRVFVKMILGKYSNKKIILDEAII